MKKFNHIFGTAATVAALLFSLTILSCSAASDGPSVIAFPPQPTPTTTPTTPEQNNAQSTPVTLETPLTLEAAAAGAVVTFVNKSAGPVTYKVNGGAAQTIASGATENITLASVGDKVEFFGANKAYATNYYSNYSNIACDKDCYVYGNIMSLIKSEGFEKATALEEGYAFTYFFRNNTHFMNKSGADLLLPATTLADDCYYMMFYGCTGLTKVPELPATTLARECYSGMFGGCTSLTSAPTLPATMLAISCYSSMFSGCTSLASAPTLPATTLADSCYKNMFSGCSRLASVPLNLPATTLADSCYHNMFTGCTSLASAPTLPATTMASLCYGGMFSGCTSLASAPTLPATMLASTCYAGMFRNCASLASAPTLPVTTLADSCYQSMFLGCTSLASAPELPATILATACFRYMFYNCSKLASITCLATDMSASECTKGWLDNVAASGTFIKASGANWSGKTGREGIPSGWTVKNK